MAILNNYETEFGMTIDNAYIRVVSSTIIEDGGKQAALVERKVYVDKTTSDLSRGTGKPLEIPGSQCAFIIQDTPETNEAEATTDYSTYFKEDLSSGYKKNVRDFGLQQGYKWLLQNDSVCNGGTSLL